MSTFQDGVVLYKSAATLVESISFYQNEKSTKNQQFYAIQMEQICCMFITKGVVYFILSLFISYDNRMIIPEKFN